MKRIFLRITSALLTGVFAISSFAAYAADGVSDWAKEEVEKAKDFGLIPDELLCDYRKGITREEFAVVMVRLFNKGDPHFPATEFEDPKDIAEIKNAEYTDAVRTALKYELMTLDEDGNFNPGKVMTRDEGAEYLGGLYGGWRTGWKLSQTANFLDKYVDDLDESIGARPGAWRVVYDFRIMRGVSERRLAPQSIFTREQYFVAISRFINNELSGLGYPPQ